MQDIKDDFPRRLKQLRTERKLSQSALAEIVGLHYTHIGRYEKGQSRPSTDALKKLADALGVTTDYLIEGETTEIAKNRLEDRELLQQFQEVEKLPDEEKKTVKSFLDAFLMKQKMVKMLAQKNHQHG